MAFIDWLRKQHEESARNQALFEGRPRVAASQAWGGYQDRPGGQRLMGRQPSPPPTSVTLTEGDDGSSKKVTKWEPEKQLKATALPSGPAVGALTPLRAKPSFGGLPLDLSRWGGQRGQIENRVSPGMMWKDPTWAGVPQARAAPQPRRVQPRSPISPEAQAAIAQVQATSGQNVDASGRPISVPSIANIGMPRVEDLRSRIAEISRQQAAIPRQQMPPPRFVPRVDPSQFPTVQDRNTGTYDAGDPRVQMGGGFDWTGRALRENIGEDFRNIGERYTNWWQNLVEENKRKRQRGNY